MEEKNEHWGPSEAPRAKGRGGQWEERERENKGKKVAGLMWRKKEKKKKG